MNINMIRTDNDQGVLKFFSKHGIDYDKHTKFMENCDECYTSENNVIKRFLMLLQHIIKNVKTKIYFIVHPNVRREYLNQQKFIRKYVDVLHGKVDPTITITDIVRNYENEYFSETLKQFDEKLDIARKLYKYSFRVDTDAPFQPVDTTNITSDPLFVGKAVEYVNWKLNGGDVKYCKTDSISK